MEPSSWGAGEDEMSGAWHGVRRQQAAFYYAGIGGGSPTPLSFAAPVSGVGLGPIKPPLLTHSAS